MTVLLVAAAVVGYALGMLSPATAAARRRGVDLREVGSGNPGATNASRALGRRTGVAVGVLDVLKGLLPALALGALDPTAGLVAGLAAVLGHVTSPLLRGRGGKGVATAFGAVLAVHPLWALPAAAVWVGVVAAVRWTGLASVLAALTVPVAALLTGQDRVWAGLLAAVVVARHRGNFLPGRR